MTAVIVAHARWSAERRETAARLVAQLGSVDGLHVSESQERERPYVWARRCWELAASLDEDVILLQDDVEVCPRFVETVGAMLGRASDATRIVSLHTTLPAAPSLAFVGERFVRCWWVTTPGYVLRRGVAADLLRWLDRLPPARVEAWNDDVAVMHFAWSRRATWGVPWSTIPALVRHDTRVASTLGYDAHANRTTNVPWTGVADHTSLTRREWWGVEDWRSLPVEIACPWAPPRWFAATELELTRKLAGDQCWACEAPAAVRVGDVLICRRCVAISASWLLDPKLAPPPSVTP